MVGYLHEWQPTPRHGGTFVYYNNESPTPEVVKYTELLVALSYACCMLVCLACLVFVFVCIVCFMWNSKSAVFVSCLC